MVIGGKATSAGLRHVLTPVGGLVLAALFLALPTSARGQEARWAGTFLVGYGTTFLSSPTPSGPGVTVDLFRFGAGTSGFGVEVGYYNLGTNSVSRTSVFSAGDTVMTSILDEASRWYVTAAIQTRPKVGNATAILLAGLGYYRANARQQITRVGVPDSINIPAFSDSRFKRDGIGANLGAGFVLASLGKHVNLNVQARGHFIIAKSTEEGGESGITFDQFATLSIGVTVD